MSTKICVNDSCNEVPVGQRLSSTFPIQKLSNNMVFDCALQYANYDGPSILRGIFLNRVLVPHSKVKAMQYPRRMKMLPAHLFEMVLYEHYAANIPMSDKATLLVSLLETYIST
jgi:hypothetical protein